MCELWEHSKITKRSPMGQKRQADPTGCEQNTEVIQANVEEESKSS